MNAHSSTVPVRPSTSAHKDDMVFSETRGKAGIFLEDTKRKLPLSGTRLFNFPLPSFRRGGSSSSASYNSPTVLRRSGDDSVEFANDAAVPTKWNESPVSSTWICEYCSYANGALDKLTCAICGNERNDPKTTTAFPPRRLPSRRHSSYERPQTISVMKRTVDASPKPPLRSFSTDRAGSFINPFDQFAPPPLPSLQRYTTPPSTGIISRSLQESSSVDHLSPHGAPTPLHSNASTQRAEMGKHAHNLTAQPMAATLGTKFPSPMSLKKMLDLPNPLYN